MSVKEFINRSEVRNLLAIITVFGAYIIFMFFKPDSDIKIALVGWVSAIFGYYYGDSKNKNTTKNA